MLGRARVKALAAASAMLFLATACTVGGGDGETSTAASPATTLGAASPTIRELPASLASATGWLAYSTFIDDHDRIHLTRVDGSQDHIAAAELPGEVIRADFSPNGQLAFEYRPSDGSPQNVFVANADGTGARVVAECKVDECERYFPAWSPDGKYLATHTTLGAAIGTADDQPPEFAIAIIDVSTQRARLILRHPSSEFTDQLPRWSPDGRKLVFYRWRAAKNQPGESPDAEAAVFTVNVDGTGLKQLTPWRMRCGDPDWSRDGSTIICTTNPPGHFDNGQGDIYAMKADGSKLHPLTKYGATGPRAGQARFTPDGKVILYVRAATQDWPSPPRHIYALDLATAQDVPVLTERDI